MGFCLRYDCESPFRSSLTPRSHGIYPAIDPALEAICLMAIAHAAEDRYATARAPADDLDRWVANEPVIAYREPVTKAVFRWLSRHPHVVIRGLIAMSPCSSSPSPASSCRAYGCRISARRTTVSPGQASPAASEIVRTWIAGGTRV